MCLIFLKNLLSTVEILLCTQIGTYNIYSGKNKLKQVMFHYKRNNIRESIWLTCLYSRQLLLSLIKNLRISKIEEPNVVRNTEVIVTTYFYDKQ